MVRVFSDKNFFISQVDNELIVEYDGYRWEKHGDKDTITEVYNCLKTNWQHNVPPNSQIINRYYGVYDVR